MSAAIIHHPSSFRDPSGYIFQKDGTIYRQVNKIFREDFDFFISGGCYDAFVSQGLLLPHETIHKNLTGDDDWHLTIKPEELKMISYPFEWSFSMLKDAALLTIRLLKEGIKWGMILKDATPYNVQWHKGKMVFIDSLSFEKYDESKPWIAYRQFCEQFLSPLLLSHYSKQPLTELVLAYPEGIPVGITSALLPGRTKFSIHTYLHIHLQAKYSRKKETIDEKNIAFSKKKLLNLANSLEILIGKLKLPVSNSTWSAYYEEASQRKNYLEEKKSMIENWLTQIKPGTTADFGANTGEFSRLASKYGLVISSDFDPFCIEELYKDLRTSKQENILPLVLDLSKPSPAIGVNNKERASFTERLNADLSFALALIHHLAIGRNIPFDLVALFFKNVTRYLIIEFVPKEDEKITLMLKNKKDIYIAYTEENFVNAFTRYFTIEEKKTISDSRRSLYLMKNNEK